MQLPIPPLDARALRAALQDEQAAHRPEAVAALLSSAAAALRRAAGPAPDAKKEATE